MSCDRFTRTVSPAANAFAGVKVTVLSPFEKASAPVALPVCLPKTWKLVDLTVEVLSPVSNVTEIGVAAGAMLFDTGLVERTTGGAAEACAATRNPTPTAAIAEATHRNRMLPPPGRPASRGDYSGFS